MFLNMYAMKRQCEWCIFKHGMQCKEGTGKTLYVCNISQQVMQYKDITGVMLCMHVSQHDMQGKDKTGKTLCDVSQQVM